VRGGQHLHSKFSRTDSVPESSCFNNRKLAAPPHRELGSEKETCRLNDDRRFPQVTSTSQLALAI
jgi:hypothetical protein